jgi:5-methylcytosine-specific restriction endonuclease McrBC regulatory subunit McrC
VSATVDGERWDGDVQGDPDALARLPTMNTDVEIRQGNQLTILDCKFYKEAFTHNRDIERYKTPNL